MPCIRNWSYIYEKDNEKGSKGNDKDTQTYVFYREN
jgi:hypothetical protein